MKLEQLMNRRRRTNESASTRGRWTMPEARRPLGGALVRFWTLRLVVVAAVVLTGVAALGPLRSTGANAPEPHDHSTHSHVASAPEDKETKAEDKCAKMRLKRVGTTKFCTHGPDPAPPGYNVGESTDPVNTTSDAPASVSCDDGTSGNRVQVVYARASDRADRYDSYVSSFRSWAAQADDIFNTSAGKTGGSRHIRFVTTGGSSCAIVVQRVTLSSTGDDNFTNTINEMTAQGFTATNRKYMVFMDANVLCGIGSIDPDTRRDAANQNNFGPTIGRTDAGCWGPQTIAHELMHNLGGVQMDSPNSSGGWHCTDEYDVMCYSDSPDYPAMTVACGNSALEKQFDCNNDDYYSSNPPAGSYLATHWNAAQNQFLIGAVDQPPMPPPANDPFSGAIRASERPYKNTQDATMATSAADDPSVKCYGYRVTQSVWYTTTPATSGTLTVDTVGSRYGTVLSIWTGSQGQLTSVGCNHKSGGTDAKVAIPVTAGTAYYVMVIPYYTNGAGSLTLNVTGPADSTAATATPTRTATPTATATATATTLTTGVGTPISAATSTVAPQIPSVTLSKDKSKYNGLVEAKLSGFAPNSTVELLWPKLIPTLPTDDVETNILARGTTDGAGAVTLTFLTPLDTLGDYRITARDATGATATTALRVIPRIMLNEDSGGPDLRWRVYFYGFGAGDQIEVRWHTGSTTASSYLVINTLTVADNGRASAIIPIPKGQDAGVHMIVGKVIGVSRSASTPFTLTSSSPAAPAPTDTPTAVATSTPVPTSTPEPVNTRVPNGSPTADAGDDQTVTDGDGSGGEDVALDGSRSSDPEGRDLAYSWSIGGSEIATGVNATVTLPVGTTALTLTVTDDQGAMATDEVVILVNSPPVADAGDDQWLTDMDGSGDEAVTLDGSLSYDAERSAMSYVWSRDGEEIASGSMVTIVLPVGPHAITLTVTDDLGASATDEVVVIVDPQPAGEAPAAVEVPVEEPAG